MSQESNAKLSQESSGSSGSKLSLSLSQDTVEYMCNSVGDVDPNIWSVVHYSTTFLCHVVRFALNCSDCSEEISVKGEVSSKMTYIFNWPVRISVFLGNFFLLYFIKNCHSKVKFEAKMI